MAFRILEVIVPEAELARVSDLLENQNVVHSWMTRGEQATGMVRVLLDVQNTEALTDLFVRHFGSWPGFRLILLPIEATLPVIEPEGPTPDLREEKTPKGPLRISREELIEDIAEASNVNWVYVATVVLSTVVAGVGLIRGDVAVVIGGMVIAPLLGPNIALSLSAALGDLELAKRSLKAMGVGVLLAATLSFLVGVLLDVDPTSRELAGRTHVDVSDIVLALAAGAAGALAFTTGVSSVVMGVMVAVALLPPLVVAGLMAGSGHGGEALRAFLLALTNVTCINLAAMATFYAQRVRPRTWWEAEKARRAVRFAAGAWVLLLALLVSLILLGHVRGA